MCELGHIFIPRGGVGDLPGFVPREARPVAHGIVRAAFGEEQVVEFVLGLADGLRVGNHREALHPAILRHLFPDYERTVGGVEVNGVRAVEARKIKTAPEMSDLKKRETDRELSPIWWWD